MPYVHLPKTIFDNLVDNGTIKVPPTKKAASKSLARIDEGPDDSRRITILTRRIGRLNPYPRASVCESVIDFYDAVGRQAKIKVADPKLRLDVWSERLNDRTRLGLVADIKWPEVEHSDERLSDLTTQVMCTVAKDIKYSDMDDMSARSRGQLINNLVYGQVQRSRGVTLETNPLGSCSIGTDGMEYRSESPVFNAQSHNVHGHDQQLIILSGAIALAHADELLSGPLASVTIAE